MRKINIPGKSGCYINIFEHDERGTYFVRKSVNDFSYKERLKKQAEKQRLFREQNCSVIVTTPKILNSGEFQNEFYFDMEYFGSIDCITFLETGCIADIELLLEFLIAVISANIIESPLRELDMGIFMAKYEDVRRQISASPFVEESALRYGKIERMFNEIPPGEIPIGRCHGDLTLSNILVKPVEKQFGVIDFLDCFIETPLQDMVKVRQDTYYYWTPRFCRTSSDTRRLTAIFGYLDKRIDQFFNTFPYYAPYYAPFQALNLLRILPYCDKMSISNLLVKDINKLVKDY
jgi:hypothetical protein